MKSVKTLMACALLSGCSGQQKLQPSPPVVEVAQVKTQQMQDSYEFISITESLEQLEVVSRVNGYIIERLYIEGQDVEKGDILYIIDQGPFKAALLEAEGDVLRVKAELKDAETILKRQQALQPQGFASQEKLDNALARRDALLAELLTARGNLENAKLNLGYTEIKAPFAGRIGKAYYDRGDYVSADTGAMADIVILDPMRIVFAVPGDKMIEERLKTDDTILELKEIFKPVLYLPGGKAYPRPGEIDFVDNKVDIHTSMVAVRAIFSNPEKLLLPGQYLNVEITKIAPDSVLTIPITAVQQDSEGYFVYTVTDESKVHMQRIEVGKQLKTDWVVTSGLKKGESVVTTGVQKIKLGQQVTVKS